MLCYCFLSVWSTLSCIYEYCMNKVYYYYYYYYYYWIILYHFVNLLSTILQLFILLIIFHYYFINLSLYFIFWLLTNNVNGSILYFTDNFPCGKSGYIIIRRTIIIIRKISNNTLIFFSPLHLLCCLSGWHFTYFFHAVTKSGQRSVTKWPAQKQTCGGTCHFVRADIHHIA